MRRGDAEAAEQGGELGVVARRISLLDSQSHRAQFAAGLQSAFYASLCL